VNGASRKWVGGKGRIHSCGCCRKRRREIERERERERERRTRRRGQALLLSPALLPVSSYSSRNQGTHWGWIPLLSLCLALSVLLLLFRVSKI